MVVNVLLVFLGGGLGSVLRFAVGMQFTGKWGVFPLGTLVANAISCLIYAGLLRWLPVKDASDLAWRLFFLTGFCGGLSTFSTFTAETFDLVQRGMHLAALSNIFCSLLVCISIFYISLILLKVP